jgi:tRNA threonylcarbamoyladenosine biosynthesis protein TsaE
MKKIITHDLVGTEDAAKEFAKTLKPGAVVALIGDLGSGKTTFTQFVAKELGASAVVNSPTFLIQKEYMLKNDRGIDILYHLDLYRLSSEKEVEEVGLKEILLDKKAMTFIEWPEKASGLLPQDTHFLTFTYLNETTREIVIS